MSRRRWALLVVVTFLLGSVVGAPLVRHAIAVVSCSIPTTFGVLSGSVAVSLIDGNFTALNNCINTAALFTDLPLTRAYTGTQRWAKGAGLTAAATLTLGSDGNYFVVAGNTGITAISSLEAGTLIVLEFTGTPIITHNGASLILQGATNAQVAAGDVYVFVSEGGGNWREVSRRTTTNADATHFLNGQGVLASVAGTAFTQAGKNTGAEVCDGSGAAADLTVVTLSSNIAVGTPFIVVGNIRHTAVAVQPSIGLKVNATEIRTPFAWSDNSGAADDGYFEAHIGAWDATNYTHPGWLQVMSALTSTAGFLRPLTASVPNATLTSVTVRGNSGAAGSMCSKNVFVYALAN